MPTAIKPAWAKITQLQEHFPVLQLAALLVIFYIGLFTITDFGSELNIRTMLVIAAIIGFAAAGQTIVMIIGGLDLSVAGIISASGIALAYLSGISGWPLLPALLVIFATLAGLGGMTGWICHKYRINPLVVTLGTGFIALGVVIIMIGGDVKGSVPQSLTNMTSINGTTFGIAVPTIVVLWIALALALGIFLRYTVPGRRLFATGANPFAANFALINTRKVWILGFATSAVLSGIAGIMLAGFAAPDKAAGDPYFFQALTAVIVGGTTFAGARGDYTHTVVGSLLLAVLGNALVGWGLQAEDSQIIFGILILVVVAFYGRERAVRERV